MVDHTDASLKLPISGRCMHLPTDDDDVDDDGNGDGDGNNDDDDDDDDDVLADNSSQLPFFQRTV